MMQLEPTLDSSTSSDLLSQVRRSNPAAWTRFVELYTPLVYAWCRRAGACPADASDVAQEVFAKVFSAIEQFRHDRDGDTLRGWLRTICRNQLTDHYRRKGKLPQGAGGTNWQLLVNQLAVEDANEETSIHNDRRELVHRAAELVRGEFEPRTWRAFWMVAVEGCSGPDAAAQLGMTPGAVRQAKYMVLRRLREELSEDFA